MSNVVGEGLRRSYVKALVLMFGGPILMAVGLGVFAYLKQTIIGLLIILVGALCWVIASQSDVNLYKDWKKTQEILFNEGIPEPPRDLIPPRAPPQEHFYDVDQMIPIIRKKKRRITKNKKNKRFNK